MESATAGIIHRTAWSWLATEPTSRAARVAFLHGRWPLGSERAHAGLAGIGEVGVNFS